MTPLTTHSRKRTLRRTYLRGCQAIAIRLQVFLLRPFIRPFGIALKAFVGVLCYLLLHR